tara:strand:+ start:70 stop:183 length:114 start_codon:yes stop_codon:yes gene_type:complete
LAKYVFVAGSTKVPKKKGNPSIWNEADKQTKCFLGLK